MVQCLCWVGLGVTCNNTLNPEPRVGNVLVYRESFWTQFLPSVKEKIAYNTVADPGGGDRRGRARPGPLKISHKKRWPPKAPA